MKKSPKNRQFFGLFFEKKKVMILTLKLFPVFDLTVQISSAFLEESNNYIFYPTVDFKSEA